MLNKNNAIAIDISSSRKAKSIFDVPKQIEIIVKKIEIAVPRRSKITAKIYLLFTIFFLVTGRESA